MQFVIVSDRVLKMFIILGPVVFDQYQDMWHEDDGPFL